VKGEAVAVESAIFDLGLLSGMRHAREICRSNSFVAALANT
jgi:hypothetical protein